MSRKSYAIDMQRDDFIHPTILILFTYNLPQELSGQTKQIMTPNYHILIIQEVRATNTQAARVKIISEPFKASIIIPFSNEPGSFNPMLETAEKWLIAKDFKLIGSGEGKGHNYIIAATFKTPAPPTPRGKTAMSLSSQAYFDLP